MDTSSNWGKSIQNALVTLLVLLVGVGFSVAIESLLPSVVAIAGCCAWGWHAAYAAWKAKQRVDALERVMVG